MSRISQLFIPLTGKDIPTGPYYFKDGDNAGKFMDLMMFNDYPSLLKYKKNTERLFDKKNLAHRHVDWLFARGDDRIAQINCPYCNQNTATHFLVDFNIKTNEPTFKSIHCSKCRVYDSLNSQSFPLKFSVLRKFSEIYSEDTEIHHQKIIAIFKKVFVLPGEIDENIAFAFFARIRQDQHDPSLVDTPKEIFGF